MKRIGLIGVAVTLLMFGNVAGTFAQDQEHGKGKDKGNKGNPQQAQPQPAPQPQPLTAQQVQQQAQQQQQMIRNQNAQRASQQEQYQRFQEQQQRTAAYQAALDQQVRAAQQQNAQIQQNRRSQWQIQQQYAERIRQQQQQVQADRNYDFRNDAYFNTPWRYRYNVGGYYRQTNQYGADLLQQAVNSGYQQGFLAGDADRHDRFRYDYRDSFAYRDANYGYRGRYVAQSDYNYYFRLGFRKGYDDGYYRRSRYGHRVNGSYAVFNVVLGGILRLEVIR